MNQRRPLAFLRDAVANATKTRLVLLATVATLASGLLGLACQPSIGDACILSTDCSQRGDRLCDTSQSGGYCTVFNCSPNGCPDEAACVVFGATVPGCTYSDRGIARTARSFCVKLCEADTDCRTGYECALPASRAGVALDDAGARKVCVPRAYYDSGVPVVPSPGNAPNVCGSSLPTEDGGSSTVTDAGTTDASDAAASPDAR
jgi:hypothetical protein